MAARTVNRQFTPSNADNYSPQRRRVRRGKQFCPIGRRRLGKWLRASRELCFCLSSSPDKQKVNSLRPLRLCGEILKESYFSPNLACFASLRESSDFGFWIQDFRFGIEFQRYKGEGKKSVEAIVVALGGGYHALRMYHIIPSGKVGRKMELTLLKST